MWPKANFDQISKFHFQIAPCVSTGRELSFEWSHLRISSADSKVRLALQNSIKYSGSEGVKMLIISLVLDVLCQQGDVDQVDSSPLRPRKDVLTKQYKKKHHGSPIVPPLELYKLQQQDSLPDYAQLSPRERYDGLSTEEALLSPRTRPLTVDTRTIPHECPPSPPHQQVEHSWFERRLVLTFLACMFCFLNAGHVIILYRTVPFKFRLIHVHIYA